MLACTATISKRPVELLPSIPTREQLGSERGPPNPLRGEGVNYYFRHAQYIVNQLTEIQTGDKESLDFRQDPTPGKTLQ